MDFLTASQRPQPLSPSPGREAPALCWSTRSTGWPWAAFLRHLPRREGGALLLHRHGNYSTAVSCGLWAPSPCVCLISFRIKHISSLKELREGLKM